MAWRCFLDWAQARRARLELMHPPLATRRNQDAYLDAHRAVLSDAVGHSSSSLIKLGVNQFHLEWANKGRLSEWICPHRLKND